jgi:hypothetical protein
MLVNILLGLLIFGYAAFTLLRFVKRSKLGKCQACSMKKTCSSPCADIKTDPSN